MLNAGVLAVGIGAHDDRIVGLGIEGNRSGAGDGLGCDRVRFRFALKLHQRQSGRARASDEVSPAVQVASGDAGRHVEVPAPRSGAVVDIQHAVRADDDDLTDAFVEANDAFPGGAGRRKARGASRRGRDRRRRFPGDR